MEYECKILFKALKQFTKVDKNCNVYLGLRDELRSWLIFLPILTCLHSDSIRERHWDAIRALVNVDFKWRDPGFALKDVFQLNLGKYSDEIEEILDQADQERRI